MKKNNPIIIPRNHKVEEALSAAEKGDFKIMNKLLSILKYPYKIQDNISDFQTPTQFNNKYKTFCGT